MTETHAERIDALAALFGITPETHKHLFKLRLHCCECGSESRLAHGSTWFCSNDSCPAFDYGFYGAKGYKQAQRLVADLPDPLGPDADGVWLAPAVRWGCDMTTPHCYFASVEFAPQMGGGWHCHVDAYGPLPSGKREHEAFGDSMTAAYLQACQAAWVPEIVEIFGRGDYGAR